MLDTIVENAPEYLLVAVRCFALIMTMPLFSSKAVSRVAKIALAGYLAFIILPKAHIALYEPYILGEGGFSIEYLCLIAGEAMIGVVLGFFTSMIFSAFSTAGQLFAFQIGFSAAEVYDALSQVENPLMGQFLNLVAMSIFLSTDYAQLIFTRGLLASFRSVSAFTIASANRELAVFMLKGLSYLFSSAFVIALPIMGTLFLINVTMGILAKAAPQMNLMSEGFPLMLLTTFGILTVFLPELCAFFGGLFYEGFKTLELLFTKVAVAP